MKIAIVAAALVTAGIAAAPARAASYDIGNALNTSQFSFGTVAANGAFSAFSTANCSDIGISGTCYRGNDRYQVIAQAGAGALLVHPGPNSTTAVRFTADTAGTYRLTGEARSVDYGSKIVQFSDRGGSPVAAGTIGNADTLSLSRTIRLAAGESFAIAIDNNGSYYYDSTRLSGTIAAVPEPAMWGLMALGFGMVGGSMRRRKSALAAA